jgi:hypothetical protein
MRVKMLVTLGKEILAITEGQSPIFQAGMVDALYVFEHITRPKGHYRGALDALPRIMPGGVRTTN